MDAQKLYYFADVFFWSTFLNVPICEEAISSLKLCLNSKLDAKNTSTFFERADKLGGGFSYFVQMVYTLELVLFSISPIPLKHIFNRAVLMNYC
jgi:hypothetical protein